MARLPRLVVLVVLAFLVEAAAAHRKFRLASFTLRNLCATIVLCTCDLLLDLPRIGNIGLSFKNPQLLLMRLLSLQGHLSRRAVPILLRRAPTPIPDFGFIDSMVRISVILDVPLEGVGTF